MIGYFTVHVVIQQCNRFHDMGVSGYETTISSLLDCLEIMLKKKKKNIIQMVLTYSGFDDNI